MSRFSEYCQVGSEPGVPLTRVVDTKPIIATTAARHGAMWYDDHRAQEHVRTMPKVLCWLVKMWLVL